MYRLTLRLNKGDLDIVALSENEGFKGAVKNALYAFVSGKRYTYPMPATLPRTRKTLVRVSITFSEDKDEAVVNFLKSIKNGAKNAVVLSIIRASLPFPVVSPFLDDDGVFYDIHANRKKRGRKKGSVNQRTAIQEPSAMANRAEDRADNRAMQPESAATPIATPVVDKMAEEPAATTVPPVRPSLVAAVEEEQADREGQTATETTDATDTTDSFDPFALGADMMNSF